MARIKRKVKKNLLRFSIFIIIIGIFSISSFQVYDKLIKNNDIKIFSKDKQKDEEIKQEEKEIWPKEYKIDLLATGDGLIHNLLADYAKEKDGTYDFKPYLTEVKDIVSEYDIAYYNQETVFGGEEIGYSYYPTFNTPSAYGDAMLDAGFNTVSIASNHSYDRGEKAVINTVYYWQEKYKEDNIMYNGMALSEEDRTNYIIMEKNNITYALLSYTYSTNGIPVPKEKPYYVSVYNKDIATKDIEAIRDKVDVLIVAMHWGVEYQFEPTKPQKEQAAYLASLGVDIIIGNHPHCIQPIEWQDDTLVIYSLGNFISNQMELKNSIGYKGVIGAFAMVDIHKTLYEDGTSEITLDNLNIDLLYTYRYPEKGIDYKNGYYKVIPFSKMNNKYLNNYMDVYEDYKKVIQKYDETINVLPAA